MLREREKTFFLAANKVDTREGAEGTPLFHELAVDTVYPISAEHGTGVGDLIAAVAAVIPEEPDAEEDEEELLPRIAVLGRPNVGKSIV